MSHLTGVPAPRPRQTPQWLAVLGLLLIVCLTTFSLQIIIGWLVGEWLVELVWRMIGSMAIWCWALRKAGLW